MSHSTTRRKRHSYMARPTRRTKQPILIPVAGNELRPLAGGMGLGLAVVVIAIGVWLGRRRVDVSSN
jgi:hypothetical protein